LGKLAQIVNRGYPVLRGERDDPVALAEQERVGRADKPADLLLRDR
jgi:hypothetical protein